MSEAERGGLRMLRCAAVALHLSADRATSSAVLVDSVAALLARELPREPTTATLVALPEHTGLLAMLVGERGAQARARWRDGASTVEILLALAGGYSEVLGRLAERFPGVRSPGQLLHLACTDTVVHTLVHGFGGLAAQRGEWLSVSAALPRWRWVDPAADGDGADGDGADGDGADGDGAAGDGADGDGAGGDGGGPAHVAVPTGPGVRNRQLLLSPAGELVAVHDKVALVPMEADGAAGLGLEPATLAEVEVADLPIGRVATVISKDAWMPDVNERLDQLRAQVLLQPEAFDRWDTPDRDTASGRADLWPPDKFQRGGWWMVQRHPDFRVNLAPMLRGDLGELSFDGQPVVAVPGPAGDPGLGLHGQPPGHGWAAVGAWSPAARDGLAVATVAVPRCEPSGDEVPRHDQVSDSVEVEVATRAASHAEAAGVRTVAGTALQLVPDLAVGDGHAWLAWVACDRQGRQQLRVAAGDGRSWERSVALSADPTAPGDPHDQAAPGDPVADPVPARRWAPRLVVDRHGPLCVHLGFPAGSWDVFAVRPGHATPVAVRIDDADPDQGVLRERLHDAPTVMRAGDDLVAVWSDLRWPWVLPQVRAARSHDGGATWSASWRLDGGGCEGRADPRHGRGPEETGGQTTPSVAIGEHGPVVVWQERDTTGATGLRLAWLDHAGGLQPPDVDGALFPAGASPAAGESGRIARPALAAEGATLWLVWEVWSVDGGAGLWGAVSVDGGRRWSPPCPLDPARPGGTTARRARVVAVDHDAAVVVFEDDRVGTARILVVDLAVTGADTLRSTPPRRVDDAPVGSHARAPTAARFGDRLVVAWQDTRTGAERLRSALLTL